MIVYIPCYLLSFILAGQGWYVPSGLMLMIGAAALYLQDYRASGNLIHLRGLFCFFFVGGQGLSCFKLSHLQSRWSNTAWLCFLCAVVFFWLSFEVTKRKIGPVKEMYWLKKRARGAMGILPREYHMNFRRYEKRIFHMIVLLTVVSLAAFCIEAAVLGYVPLFVRGVPHAYSAFHLSGIHYFTVSCVLVPPLFVLYFMGRDEKRKRRNRIAELCTVISLFIPILCVSRFQFMFALILAAFTFLAVRHRMRVIYILGLAALLVPVYLLLSVARSHDVTYLNEIFEMKNPGLPIFISQPYMYISNNYDNFNYMVEHLPAHTMGLRMLFPVFALTGLKFLKPGLVDFPLYVTKTELTTLTLIYDAYYDFGLLGIVLFAAVLGFACCLLVRNLPVLKNPVGYLFYAQIAAYLTLSFFTTWFSNPTTWFYLAVTGVVYVYAEYS